MQQVVSLHKFLLQDVLAKSLEGLQVLAPGQVAGRDIHWEKGPEKIKNSVKILAYANPPNSCHWLPQAEDAGVDDLCSEPVLLCFGASPAFCPVLLLGDTV